MDSERLRELLNMARYAKYPKRKYTVFYEGENMTFGSTNNSDNQLRGRIHSMYDIHDLTVKHLKKEEKKESERCRKVIVEKFKRWESEESSCRSIIVKCPVTSTVQQELKELGYAVKVEAGEWFISW